MSCGSCGCGLGEAKSGWTSTSSRDRNWQSTSRLQKPSRGERRDDHYLRRFAGDRACGGRRRGACGGRPSENVVGPLEAPGCTERVFSTGAALPRPEFFRDQSDLAHLKKGRKM